MGKCIEADLHIKVQQVRDQQMDTQRDCVCCTLWSNRLICNCACARAGVSVCAKCKEEQISDPAVAEAGAPSCDVTVNDSK